MCSRFMKDRDGENVLINEENMPRSEKKFFEEHRGED